MKSLQQHIEEKLIINKDYKKPEKLKDGLFKYVINSWTTIKVFDEDWSFFNTYKNKVYINGEHAELDDGGRITDTYKPGIYIVEIKNLKNINDCSNMFWGCSQLIEASSFDTSNVRYMDCMFNWCESLEEVPLLNTDSIGTMDNMFAECPNLSEETKEQWSQVYDFNTNKKKK